VIASGSSRSSRPGRPVRPDREPFDAVVLAGGAARRFGGVNKCTLLVDGRAVLARVTDAVGAAQRVVLVGSPVPGARADIVTREEPAGGGPVAALAAGLRFVQAPLVVVLAGDLPALTADAVTQLVASVAGADRAAAVDADGRAQLLCAAWRTAALRVALAGVDVSGAPMRALVPVRDRSVRLSGEPPPWQDCDTPAELAAVRDVIQRPRVGSARSDGGRP
jgi:molybdopterin-guanine dinucleotide biosynthesis protein A